MDSFNGPFLVPLTPRARRSQGHPQRQCFNSHPARRPDATGGWCSPRSTPPGFNPHPARRPDATSHAVSSCCLWLWFQSSPGQKAGCNLGVARASIPITCFNPHPARRPDATLRMVQSTHHWRWCFNPHPARRPDATWNAQQSTLGTSCFNPHPARRPDATTAPIAMSGAL